MRLKKHLDQLAAGCVRTSDELITQKDLKTKHTQKESGLIEKKTMAIKNDVAL